MPDIDFRERQRRRRRKLRARGRRAYILRAGVLGWGMTAWTLFTAIGPLLEAWLFGRPIPPAPHLLVRALAGLPIWLVGGYFFGAWMWRNGED